MEHSRDPFSLSKRAAKEAWRLRAESKALIAKSACGPGCLGDWVLGLGTFAR